MVIASTNGSLQEQRNKAETFLLDILYEDSTPISLQALEEVALQKALPSRAIKEAIWKLVEEGKVQFTSAWDLEACYGNSI